MFQVAVMIIAPFNSWAECKSPKQPQIYSIFPYTIIFVLTKKASHTSSEADGLLYFMGQLMQALNDQLCLLNNA